MPDKKRLKGREETMVQSTFNYTVAGRKEYARPVSSWVTPGHDKTAAQLYEAVNASQRGMYLKSIGDRKEKNEARSTAMAAFMRGETLDPDTASQAETDAFEFIGGQAAVANLEQDLYNLVVNGADLSPQEYIERREEVVERYTSDRSEAFLNGLGPNAYRTIQRYDKQFNGVKQGQYKEQALGSVRNIATSNFRRAIEDGEQPGELREMLSNLQSQAKVLGLSRTEVSQQAIDVITEYAVETGDPSYLAFLDEPDESGMSLSMNPKLNTQIERAQEAARSARDGYIAKRDKMVKEAREDAQNELSLGLIDAAYSDDAHQVARAEQALITNKDLFKPTTYKSMRALLQKTQEEGAFARASDPLTLMRLFRDADAGILDNERLLASSSGLTAGDFKMIMKKKQSRLSETRGTSKTGSKSPTEEALDKIGWDKMASAGGSVLLSDAMEQHLFTSSAKSIDLTRRKNAKMYYQGLSAFAKQQYLEDLEASGEKPTVEGAMAVLQDVMAVAQSDTGEGLVSPKEVTLKPQADTKAAIDESAIQELMDLGSM